MSLAAVCKSSIQEGLGYNVPCSGAVLYRHKVIPWQCFAGVDVLYNPGIFTPCYSPSSIFTAIHCLLSKHPLVKAYHPHMSCRVRGYVTGKCSLGGSWIKKVRYTSPKLLQQVEQYW